jgi:hypothetical protein
MLGRHPVPATSSMGGGESPAYVIWAERRKLERKTERKLK